MRVYQKLFRKLFLGRYSDQQSSDSSGGSWGNEGSLREEDTSSTVRASGVGLWSYDFGADHMRMNVNMVRMLGVKHVPKSAVPLTCDSLNMLPEDQPAFMQSLGDAVSAGQRLWSHDFRVRKESPGPCTIRISAELHHEKGNTIMSGAAMDVTELIRAVEVQKGLDVMELRHQQDMKHQKEMHSMIRTICHEIRNPLQAIISNAESITRLLDALLQEGTEEASVAHATAGIRECVKDIQTCTLYQSQTLNDLIDFETMHLRTFRPDHDLVTVNLDAFVMSVASMFRQPCAQKGVSMQVHCSTGLKVSLHGRAVNTVLTNLIANAAKFTLQGYIEVRVELPDLGTAGAGTTTVQVQILDTGPGVPVSIRDKLFKSYGVKADHSITTLRAGSGLGLRIVALICDAIGGTIAFKPRDPLPGSVFTFTFPASGVVHAATTVAAEQKKEEEQVVEEEERPSFANSLGVRHRVLFAEDNLLIQKMYTRLFGTAFDVDVACDGEQALKMHREAHAQRVPYDVIVLDMIMPKLGGMDVAHAIRQFPDLTPIIFCTGEIAEQLRTKVASEQHMHLILKPVQIPQFLAAIRVALEKI